MYLHFTICLGFNPWTQYLCFDRHDIIPWEDISKHLLRFVTEVKGGVDVHRYMHCLNNGCQIFTSIKNR